MFSYIFAQMQKSPVNYAFLVMSGGLFLICLQEFVIYQPIPAQTAATLGRISMFFLTVVTISSLYFSYAVARKGKIDLLFKLISTLMIISSLLIFFIQFFNIHSITGVGRYTPTMLSILIFAPMLLSLFRNAQILAQGWRNGETPTLRNQCKLILSGNILSIVLFVLVLIILPLIVKNMSLYRFSSLSTLITMAFIYRAMQHYGLMVVNITAIKNVSDMLFSNVDYGIVVTDSNGRIVQSNRLFDEIFSQTEKILSFATIKKLLPDIDFSAKFTGKIATLSFDDRQKFLEISHADFDDKHPQLGSMTIFRDITELRRREIASADKLRLESLGRLAGGVAHDFNNQLTGIMGCADLLRESLSHMPAIRHFAEIIVESAERSAKLTRQMLAFSRKGNFQKVAVDICSIIDDTILFLEHSIDKRIKISKHIIASGSIVMGDPEQLHHTLLNIALNARDAMPDGGSLDFSVTSAMSSPLPEEHSHTTSAPHPCVRITVKDTGTGIPSQLLSKVFEPFFTTKEKGKGTGLGLAAAYGTIQAHNGSIQLHSEIGKGTEVIIELPTVATSDSITIAEPAGQTESKSIEKLRVLVVEDEPVVWTQIQETLHRAGSKTTIFERGIEAIAYYSIHWRELDLVVLDIVLPDTTGLKVFTDMKAINPNVKTLLSSGYTVDGGVQQILDAGALDFIQKPYRSEELLNKVRSVVNRTNSVV